MSIDDDLLELDSITEGDRALALFTDRYEFTRLFVERLNDDPAPQTILFLYGEGGNGKSLLLKHLRKNACKRLISETDWQTIKAKPDAELADNITRLKPQVCRAVPTAFLDFGSKLLGNAQPQDRFYGLLTLRKDLGESAKGNYALAFRRFDFACVWYLYKKGKSPDEIKAFFPLDQAGNLASVLVDVLTKNPFGTASKAVLDAFNPEWSQKLMVQMARFGLDKDDIETIFRLNVDTNLIETLPRFLADDLNEAMAKDNAPPRIVLFFDTHEAFWGESRTEANITYFFRDEWLRYLLRKLDYEKGIVAVVAGRNQPRWAEAKTVKPNTDIPSQYIDLHRVGNLSAADALAYLQQPAVGIADVALCQSLIAYASVEPGEVHPLHLGLCADVVLQAQSQGTPLTAAAFNTVPEFAEKSKLLVERLLKYVNSNMRDAIYALSACRAFDFELFNQLGEALKFAPYRANFESITHFSFVKQLPTPRQSWHRLHNLLRRLNYQDGNERVSESHRFLEQLYRTKDDQAEAIYHLNQLSPSSGVEEWVSTFEQALRLSQYHACETLLEIRSDLRLISYFQLGSLSQAEGDYYHYLARVEEAEQEYVEAGWAFQRSREEEGNALGAIINQGNTYTKLGDLYRGRSRCPDALASYQKAITVYDETLQRTPDDIRILNNRGNALAHLGELQSEVSQHDDAFISFQMATESFDKVLQLDPDDIHALNNKGNTLQSIGRLCAKLSQHLEAMASYQQAIITYNEVLHHTPDEVQVLSNKGNVLAHLGESQVKLSKYTNALSSFQLAITSYNEALSHASDEIHISKASIIVSVTERPAVQGRD
jgi:tetratricopeptide (TPR) repeat protein